MKGSDQRTEGQNRANGEIELPGDHQQAHTKDDDYVPLSPPFR